MQVLTADVPSEGFGTSEAVEEAETPDTVGGITRYYERYRCDLSSTGIQFTFICCVVRRD